MISVHMITNHRHGPTGLQADMCVCIYIYIYIYIIWTRLVYTTDTVPLSYRLVCHNSTFVRLLWVYKFILNLNLTVNILLRAFKSIFFRKIQYNMYFFTNKSFQYSHNFHVIHFAINQFLKFLNLNQLEIHFTIYLHQINLKQFNMQFNLSRPDSRPDSIGGSEPTSRCETIYWDSLHVFIYLFLFFL